MGWGTLNRLRLNVVYISLLLAGIQFAPVRTQTYTQEQVVFLPLITQSDNQDLTKDLYRGLLTSIRLNPAYRLAGIDEVESLLSGTSVADLISNEFRMSELCERSGIAFLIGGIVERASGGSIELNLMVFNRDDRRIISLILETYENEDAARAGIEALALELARRKHYLTTDTTFLSSIIVPGLGQIQKQKPVHALVSAGLVAGSLIYWMSIDEADPFYFLSTDYRFQLDPLTEEYSYYYRNSEVTKTEFYAHRNEDWEHYIIAKAERRAVDIRKRRGLGLFCTAYLINILDAVLLSRQKIDPTSFFLSLEAEPPALFGTMSRELRLRLVLHFR
ncbi:hypothetical protein ACFL39_00215 [Gemmatimonadota bacterium]